MKYHTWDSLSWASVRSFASSDQSYTSAHRLRHAAIFGTRSGEAECSARLWWTCRCLVARCQSLHSVRINIFKCLFRFLLMIIITFLSVPKGTRVWVIQFAFLCVHFANFVVPLVYSFRLCGYPPFDDSETAPMPLRDQMEQAAFLFPSDPWDRISREGQFGFFFLLFFWVALIWFSSALMFLIQMSIIIIVRGFEFTT